MKALIAAKYNKVSVAEANDFQFGVANKAPEFLSKFPLGKVPAFETVDGPIYESNAIAYYVANSKDDTQLLGKTKYEAALIQQYLCFLDNEINPNAGAWIYPILGYMPYNKDAEKKAQENVKKFMTVLNKVLSTTTYLVGECITLADICVACGLYGLYTAVMDEKFRKEFVNVNRWFTTCINQPEFKEVMGEVKMCVKPMVYEPKKVEEKKEEKKPVVAEAAEEDEAAKEEKKKNPLDLLPPSSFNLDDWKRFYSNNETRPTATDYFWKNFDKEGYSMYLLKYKYNDELARIFMSCNLITGLYQRMERLRKYAFGSICVFGEDNNNEIVGMFIFRGQEIPPEMIDVPDYESYDFVKINTDDNASREMWNDFIAWDGKFHGGKVFSEGKIFK